MNVQEATGPLINGQIVAGSGAPLAIISPSTGAVVAEVGAADLDQVDQAATVADEAFRDRRWRSLPVLTRQRILSDVAAAIRAHDRELARVIAQDMGMPEGTARFIEVPMAAAVFDYYAGLTTRALGEVVPVDVPSAPPEYLAYTVREPVGPVGLITPWNFPLLLPAWKIAPALAAGCTVVLKPAPETPRIALLLGQLLLEAGVPEGVVNVVPGGDTVGQWLVEHPRLPKISVTGETETGRRVMAKAAPRLKRLSLELGGKSPASVFADADLDEAVSQCLFGIYFNSGQVCQASSRILVERSVADAFVARFVERASALRVGPAEDPAVDLGPLVRAERRDRVAAYVDEARRDGATVALGGTVLPGPGFFYAPTVVTDVRPAMRLAQEEIFGPVAAVLTFDGEDEAIAIANDTVYGLAAAVFTRDLRRGLTMARALDAGTVWINTAQVLSPTLPFGGMKASGIGRELGTAGLDAFLEYKSVLVDLNRQPLTFF
jgi:phenylacetaldehyde dehydrogenase